MVKIIKAVKSLQRIRRSKKLNRQQRLLDELLYYDKLNNQLDTIDHASANVMKSLHSSRATFTKQVQKGLSENQFVLHYQPIVNTKTKTIAGVESLLRWQHPTYGLLYPSTFLPYCENCEMIIPLGEWVFKTAIEQLRQWHKIGYPVLGMSINLSNKQLNDSHLLKSIKDILEKNISIAASINIEISEDTILKDINKTLPILKSLQKLGIRLSLDDFGTGYASYNYIQILPISNIKIDKSFITNITHDLTSIRIVDSVVKLGKNLGLTITVEGVENSKQLNLISEMDCDFVQGYLYSKPVSANELTQLLYIAENDAIGFVF